MARTFLFAVVCIAMPFVLPQKNSHACNCHIRQETESIIYEKEKIILTGFYNGKNVYVQNPIGPKGVGFCVRKYPSVNGHLTTDIVESSAFEIDLKKCFLKIGEPVKIIVEHNKKCKPKILNPEVLERGYIQKK